ncbi:MAG: folate-binding protein [Burkholderiales bacterium]
MKTPIDRKPAPHADQNGEATHPDLPQRELRAALESAVACSLEHYDLLLIHGEDAQAFLQGQLTNDTLQTTQDRAQFGGYCSPNGRLLANFLLISTPEAYLLHLPSAITASFVERLRKFVLRARVHIEHAPDLFAVGLAGPKAAQGLNQIFGTLPARPLHVIRADQSFAITLPGGLFLLMGPSAGIEAHRQQSLRDAVPATSQCWDWLQIQAGIPWILPPTRDQFIPQMIGLDLLGGVGFQKGCYPGQEIVARSQYLGNIKRRLRSGHAFGPASPGDPVLAAGKNCGMVLNAAPAPNGGWDLLAVVQESGAVDPMHIGSMSGPHLTWNPALPFPAPGGP